MKCIFNEYRSNCVDVERVAWNEIGAMEEGLRGSICQLRNFRNEYLLLETVRKLLFNTAMRIKMEKREGMID